MLTEGEGVDLGVVGATVGDGARLTIRREREGASLTKDARLTRTSQVAAVSQKTRERGETSARR